MNSEIETASTTITMGSNMQLFAVLATFKAAGGGGGQAAAASAGDDLVSASTLGLLDRADGNTAIFGTLLRAVPETVNAVAAMYQASGSTVLETNYYVFGGQAVAMRRFVDDNDQGVELLVGDHLGSTTVSYAADGSDTRRQYYNPWGQVRHSDPTVVETDIGYTGQRSDTSTGLMFYNARYYDPAMGRFISADTIIPDPMDPQDLNRYSYVRNNPAKYTDPTGHAIDQPGDCGSAEIGIGGECLAGPDTGNSAGLPGVGPSSHGQDLLDSWDWTQSDQQEGGVFALLRQLSIDDLGYFHKRVQAHFVQMTGATAEVPAPGAGPNGGMGRVDLMLGTEIWEVKPWSDLHIGDGPIKLERYLAALPGTVPGAPVKFVVPPDRFGYEIVVGYGEIPGMIYYYPRKARPNKPAPQPEYAPEPVSVPGEVTGVGIAAVLGYLVYKGISAYGCGSGFVPACGGLLTP